MRISSTDRARVEDAIRKAEQQGGAEFVCVLARHASSYEYHPLLAATIVGLLSPWVLLPLVSWAVMTLLAVQLAVFAAALALLGLPPIRRLLVPRRIQRATAHRAAAEQFFIRDLDRTPARRGVLLFVACEEHYARVLADDGAAEAVPPENWQGAVKLMIDASRDGRHADGFVAALAHCAAVLSASRPTSMPADAANTLPDRFIVLG